MNWRSSTGPDIHPVDMLVDPAPDAHIRHQDTFHMPREDVVSTDCCMAMLRAIYATPATAYQSYSDLQKPLRSFAEPGPLLDFIAGGRANGNDHFGLSVHYPDTGGSVHIETIELNPAKCPGATWREKPEGWGLINVQLSFHPGAMATCRISANSEERAAAWAHTRPHLGDPALWNWPLVEKHTRRLIRQLRRGA
jgi:hypothetical protein